MSDVEQALDEHPTMRSIFPAWSTRTEATISWRSAVVSSQAPAAKTRTWRPCTSTIPWAELMRRTLDIDPAKCPRCEGRLEPIAIITRHDGVERILSHLHFPTGPESVGPGGSLPFSAA